jgi:CBS domain-containing protein
MNVADLMTRNPQTCGPDDMLNRAAQIMWENDCGCVAVVDADGKAIGMLTDRDICMSAYTSGQPLWQIPVSEAMSKHVHGVREDDLLDVVESLMRRVRVRRVPVLDGDGRIKGILSMNDLARHAHRTAGRNGNGNGLSGDSIWRTLAAISEPRDLPSEERAATNGASAQHTA